MSDSVSTAESFVFNRKLMFGGLLAAAAAVPYVATHKDLLQKARSLLGEQGPIGSSSTNGSFLTTEVAATSANQGGSWSAWDLLGGSSGSSTPAIVPVEPLAAPIDYAEILRFELTPEYILQRWPRVSVVAGEGGLTALRLPLVTGPREDDLAGSLSYYFDNRRQMQRIVLQGTTGDPRRLVSLVTRQHEFQQLPSLSAGLYVCVQNNEPQSLLQIAYAPVVQATDPHHRAMVVLELNRPGSLLSEAGRQLLQHDKQLSHW